MARQAKTYRLPDQTVDLIAETAERDGCSATQVIVQAIAMYCGRAATDNTDSNTPSKVVDMLAEQLATKDQQIEHLHLLLNQSQQQVVLLNQQLALPAAKKGKKKGRKKKKKGKE